MPKHLQALTPMPLRITFERARPTGNRELQLTAYERNLKQGAAGRDHRQITMEQA